MTTQPTLISGVIGSGVSVCLHDRKKKTGGMNLFQLPYVQERHLATARYGNAATLTLIRMMIRNGSHAHHLEAQILGGAYNSGFSSENIGRKNVTAARTLLSRHSITIVSEDIGGQKGRKVVFNTRTSEVAVIKVDRLRAGDWYPYSGSR